MRFFCLPEHRPVFGGGAGRRMPGRCRFSGYPCSGISFYFCQHKILGESTLHYGDTEKSAQSVVVRCSLHADGRTQMTSEACRILVGHHQKILANRVLTSASTYVTMVSYDIITASQPQPIVEGAVGDSADPSRSSPLGGRLFCLRRAQDGARCGSQGPILFERFSEWKETTMIVRRWTYKVKPANTKECIALIKEGLGGLTQPARLHLPHGPWVHTGLRAGV